MEQEEISYFIIRSKRKTIAIQIEEQGKVIVRCPYSVSGETVRQFVESKSKWIREHQAKKASQPRLPKLTDEDIRALASRAMEVIPKRAAYYAPLVGVTYGRITIRNQRSRWGSCSSQGNLNFNCLLMLVPPDVMDYVVVHELCHRKEMNHSARFWAEVSRILPDYRQKEAWLKENGGALISRMT